MSGITTRARATKVAILVGAALVWGVSTGSALAAPPTIDRQWVSHVSEDNATLNAEINPNGLTTKFMLQLDTTGNFRFDQNDSCILHPPGVFCFQALVPGEPLPSGLVLPPELTLSAGFESRHVSVRMSDIGAVLRPGTTYHYRAIAASGLELIEGPAMTFTTPLPGEGPPVEEEPLPEEPPLEEPPLEEPPLEEKEPPVDEASHDPANGEQAPVPPFLTIAGSSTPTSRPDHRPRPNPKKIGRCASKTLPRKSSQARDGKQPRHRGAPDRRACALIHAARVAGR